MEDNKKENERLYIRAIEISGQLVSGVMSLADVEQDGFFDEIRKVVPKLRHEIEYVTLVKNNFLAVGISRQVTRESNGEWLGAELVLTGRRDSSLFRFVDCNFIEYLNLDFLSLNKEVISYGVSNQYKESYYSYRYVSKGNVSLEFEFKVPESHYNNQKCPVFFSSVEIKNSK